VLKWVITYGESLVLKFSETLLNQDLYSTINNLGKSVTERGREGEKKREGKRDRERRHSG
jgi:hypothetical protein